MRHENKIVFFFSLKRKSICFGYYLSHVKMGCFIKGQFCSLIHRLNIAHSKRIMSKSIKTFFADLPTKIMSKLPSFAK